MAGVSSDMFSSQSGVSSAQGGLLSKMRTGKKTGSAGKAVGKSANRAGAPKPAPKADRLTKSPELRESKGAGQQSDMFSAQMNAMQKLFTGR